MLRVQQTAASTDRSITRPGAQTRFKMPDRTLLFWRRFIDTAVAEACRTEHGLPTAAAIMARHWIEDEALRSDREAWVGSLECACVTLSMDVDTERARLIAVIDDAWLKANKHDFEWAVNRLRAAALTCAGVPTALDGQYVLGLVSAHDYDDVAGVEYPDPRNAKMPENLSVSG